MYPTPPSTKPSGPEAVFPEGQCHCRGTFHARGCFPGRSALFPGDLPCQRLFSRKVLRFSGGPSIPGRSCVFPGDLPCQGPFLRKVGAIPGGPSGPEAVFPEGRRHSGGTFHARGCFSGRSVPLQGDLPCQEPFSRKVGAIPGGPSMPEAVFPEGPAFFRGTFSRKVLRFSGGPSMPGAVFKEGRCHSRGTFRARGCFPGRSNIRDKVRNKWDIVAIFAV